ncbi:MAG: hypothetical protein AB7I52_03595 [Rhizobiaceae bacterium]
MKAILRRLLGVKPSAPLDVPPAPRDPIIENRIKEAQAALAGELLKVGRTSWEIRQELAGNALSIVSGERR